MEKLPNDELHNLKFSPIIIRMMKSRSMRWVGHVTHMVGMRNARKPDRKKTTSETRHRGNTNLNKSRAQGLIQW
jgi:hypothetical protein